MSPIREAYFDGYQVAIDAFRSWCREFAAERSRADFLTAAAMMEEAARLAKSDLESTP